MSIFFLNYILNIILTYKLRTYVMLLRILEEDFNIGVLNLEYNYNKLYYLGFNYGFIEFLQLTSLYNSLPSYIFMKKCPFIYYKKEYLILSFIRNSFNKWISNKDEGYISKKNHDIVFRELNLIFYFDNDDLYYYQNKIKKLYKKTLSVW